MWRSVLAVALALVVGSCGDNLPAPPAPTADTILLSLTTATLEIDATASVTAQYHGGIETLAPDDISWSTSDVTKVTVAPPLGGRATIHAISAGHATITATGMGRTATLDVTVTPAQLVSITSDVQPRLAAGTTLTIHVTGNYTDGSMADVTQQATLTTERTTIATVSAAGVITGIKKGDTPLHAMFEGKEFTTLVTVTDATLVSIAVTGGGNVPIGLSPQLTATGTFTDASMQDVSGLVTWSANPTTFATVSATGKITTVAVGGPETITAAKGTIMGTTTVTVTNATLQSLKVTPVNPHAPKGTHPQFTAMGTFSDSSMVNLSSMVAWTSGTQSVAMIDATGRCDTFLEGTSTISAMMSGVGDMTQLTVDPAVLATIVVTPTDPTIDLGQTEQFTATGTNTDATPGDVSAAVWSSGAAAATIDAVTGLAQSQTTGSALITATVGTVFGTSTLTVGPATIVSIKVTPAAPDLAIGVDQPMTATATYTDNTQTNETANVTWSSSDLANAPISAGGVLSILATSTATITAKLGTSGPSDATDITTHLAAVGAWTAEAAFAGLTPCVDGIKFSMAADNAYACTTTAGPYHGPVAVDTTITWSGAGTGVTNLAGLSLAAHTANATTMMYNAAPSPTLANWFRSADAGATYTTVSSLVDSAAAPRYIYAGRFQPTIGNMLATWDSGTGLAQVLHGSTSPPVVVHAIATATGTPRAFAVFATNNIYTAVLGQTPTGGAATGGIFHTVDSLVTWTETDTGITNPELVDYVAIDPNDANVLYAGLLGGGRIYKSSDAGASWAASASGLPTYAKVNQLLISSVNTTVYASTSLGLYVSTDAGATWTLAGFQGRDVRALAQSSVASTLILAGVADANGVYRAQ